MEDYMKLYECTSDWSRYKKGEIIEHWLWKKFPSEIQQKHFREKTNRRDPSEVKATALATKAAKDKTDSV